MDMFNGIISEVSENNKTLCDNKMSEKYQKHTGMY